MTDRPILHTSLTRDATIEELAADGQTLARIRAMFPERTTIMALSPEGARAHLADWVPFVEAGLSHCETLAGVGALMATSDALTALEISRDLTGIREKISAAFGHIEDAALRLAGPGDTALAA